MRLQERRWEQVALTVTTPMFVGRDTTRLAEFRVPSLRGVLRYWFRFLAGPLVGHDIGRLAAAESRVFGDTETSSPITIRLQEPVLRGIERQPAWLPKKGRQIDVRYLLGQGLQEYDSAIRQNRLTRAFLDRRTVVRLDFDFGHLREVMLPVLWYAQTFGGIGARTRRGWGGFRLDLKWPWEDAVESRGKASVQFDEAFRSDGELRRNESAGGQREYPLFPSVDEWNVYYIEKTPFVGDEAWIEALDAGAVCIRQARATVLRDPDKRVPPEREDRETPEYRGLVGPFWRGKLGKGKRFDMGAFGLPVVFRSEHSGDKATVTPYLRGKPLRRASMLSLRIFESREGAVPILVLTRSELLPSQAEIRIEDGGRSVPLGWSTAGSIRRLSM